MLGRELVGGPGLGLDVFDEWVRVGAVATAFVVAVEVRSRVVPDFIGENVGPPTAFAPDGAGVRCLAVDRLRESVFQPLDRAIEFAFGVPEQ